jgi:formylglycine-generating enzyme required for sulfatase activity/class 3 adenylate cyclase
MAEIRNFKSGNRGGSPPPRSARPRRLAAIIVGDIVAYSRLMEVDEEGTHSRVKQIERDLVEPSIAEHNGTLVKTTGDGFIAIFDSPVEAVRCSIVIQQNLVGRNASLPKLSRLEYRIGVNLGDVIVEADDIYGDGVNIATRIEGLAEPGQVFISGGIYEQIKHKVVCGYESLGDRKVKNITDPVRIYKVLPDANSVAGTRGKREGVLLILLSLTVGIIATGALWWVVWQPRKVGQQARAPLTVTSSPQPSPPAAMPATAPSQSPTPVRSAAAIRAPEMIAIPNGSYAMGSNEDPTEKPVHQVTIPAFSIGKYPVTVREWNACAAAHACGFSADGNDDAPVTNVSWKDAKQYVAWLARATGKPYRLLSESEWEYAARAATQTRYWWGDKPQPGMAACKDCGDTSPERPLKVGSFKPNPFGLYDMGGTVDQWVEDCWHKTYQGAPADGSAWGEGDCTSHVLRSGSWKNDAKYLRPANRDSYDTDVRYPTHGFRIALGSS